MVSKNFFPTFCLSFFKILLLSFKKILFCMIFLLHFPKKIKKSLFFVFQKRLAIYKMEEVYGHCDGERGFLGS